MAFYDERKENSFNVSLRKDEVSVTTYHLLWLSILLGIVIQRDQCCYDEAT
jgi:hypothetical protein